MTSPHSACGRCGDGEVYVPRFVSGWMNNITSSGERLERFCIPSALSSAVQRTMARKVWPLGRVMVGCWSRVTRMAHAPVSQTVRYVTIASMGMKNGFFNTVRVNLFVVGS